MVIQYLLWYSRWLLGWCSVASKVLLGQCYGVAGWFSTMSQVVAELLLGGYEISGGF